MTQLHPRQIQSFVEQGYAVCPDIVGKSLIERTRAQAATLVSGFDASEHRSIFSTREQTRSSDQYFLESSDKIRFFLEEDAVDVDGHLTQSKERAINKIGHALHSKNEVFREFSEKAGIDQLAAQLGIHDPLQLQSMYIYKQPRIGGEVSLHQDATFLYTDPISVIGFWFALEDATLENGCLWVLPGGHRSPLRQRFRRSGDSTVFDQLDATPFDSGQLVPLEVKAGTLVMLHGLLPHLSYANRSEKSREAYSVHVIDRHANYPDDNWLRLSS